MLSRSRTSCADEYSRATSAKPGPERANFSNALRTIPRADAPVLTNGWERTLVVAWAYTTRRRHANLRKRLAPSTNEPSRLSAPHELTLFCARAPTA